MCISWRNYSAQHGKPAKPCSTPALLLLKNHFLLGHAHSAQPPPKPCPNLAPLKAIPCSTTPITCSNHAPLLCPNPALCQPCSNKPCSNLALLKPRPAQTTTCSNHDLLNHVLLKHPCPTPTSCSNHTPPKPCPSVVPAQSHTLLNHAHPLLYLTNPRSAKSCPKSYSTPPCSKKPWST